MQNSLYQVFFSFIFTSAAAEESERPTHVVLKHYGYCFWAPHRLYKSACAVDIKKYPFDTQTCVLWFQSMTKTSSEMNIMPYYHSPFDLSTYLPSLKARAGWEILANQSKHVAKPRDEGMILMYSRRASLKFTMTLKRRQGFFAYLLMIPCVFVSFLATVIFCLPPERPDRNTLGTAYSHFVPRNTTTTIVRCHMVLLL